MGNIPEEMKKVLELAISRWKEKFVGISSSEISNLLGISNENIMQIMESLCDLNYGTLNRNVELYSLKISRDPFELNVADQPTLSHIFFPSKTILVQQFYESELPQKNIPEYQTRLIRGGSQVELVFFGDEVLSKYFVHPESYQTDDSLSGGTIHSIEGTDDSKYIYLRYGKRRTIDNKILISAFLKDLAESSLDEQKYWHAHEVHEINGLDQDENFELFLARNVIGAFVDYNDPINDVLDAINNTNSVFNKNIFLRSTNPYLRFPVENTYKSLCDCCSELYKLLGPDNINQNAIKDYLMNDFLLSEESFTHNESKRPLSSLQLLTLLEEKLYASSNLTKIFKEIGKYRIDADHKITERLEQNSTFQEIFVNLCQSAINALNNLSTKLVERDSSKLTAPILIIQWGESDELNDYEMLQKRINDLALVFIKIIEGDEKLCKEIHEIAYNVYLKREKSSQEGDVFSDWIDAESILVASRQNFDHNLPRVDYIKIESTKPFDFKNILHKTISNWRNPQLLYIAAHGNYRNICYDQNCSVSVPLVDLNLILNDSLLAKNVYLVYGCCEVMKYNDKITEQISNKVTSIHGFTGKPRSIDVVNLLLSIYVDDLALYWAFHKANLEVFGNGVSGDVGIQTAFQDLQNKI